MKKLFLLLGCAFLISLNLFAQKNPQNHLPKEQPTFAPVNPAYVKYLDDNNPEKRKSIGSANINDINPDNNIPDDQKSKAPVHIEYQKYPDISNADIKKSKNDDGHGLGLIPSPVKKDFTAYIFNKSCITDVSYDMRTAGPGGTSLLTSVKDQGNCGSCWAFATMSSIESRWKILGYGEYDLSEDNLNNCHGFYWGPCQGGNLDISASYLSRKSGPMSEADDPYTGAANNCPSGINEQGYVYDICYLPNDINTIKQAILDYGALYTTFYYSSIYFNSNNNTYYYNGNDNSNHAVTLVGWDNNKLTAGGTGAWIIKNSWGTSWGENGFFYISFNDSKINEEIGYFPSRIAYNSFAHVYKYDDLGNCAPPVGFNSNTAYGLVKYTVTGNQPILKVGTWLTASNATVSIDVYGNFNGVTLSNLLGSIPPQHRVLPGYYTFDLPSAINISAGNNFYIKVQYNTPSYNYPVPLEGTYAYYAYPTIETGKCWTSSNGTSWLAFGGGTSYPYDVCIKAYASGCIFPDAAGTISGVTSVCQGQSYVTYTVPPITNAASYIWTLPTGATGTSTTNSITVNYGSSAISGNITVSSHSPCGDGAASSLAITVNSQSATAVNITASPSSTVCQGTNVTFTATATPPPGVAVLSYQWYLNGLAVGSNSETYSSSIITNGDQVSCTVITDATSCFEVFSNSMVMNVEPVTSSVSISASPSSSICVGMNTSFIAAPVNGGSAPVYQWFLNGSPVGSNSQTFSNSSLVSGDQVWCTMTSSYMCLSNSPVTSNIITITVNPDYPFNATISADHTSPVCAGTTVWYTATPHDPGPNPLYEFQLGSFIYTTTSSSIGCSWNPGTYTVGCRMLSSLPCASWTPWSDLITTVVPSNAVSVSISSNPSSPVCSGTNVVFTATPVNGGTLPVYQWKKNGSNVGANSNTYSSSSISDGDIISCTLTSNGSCPTGSPATSNSIKMAVNPLVSINISASPSSTVCPGTNVTFTATPTNGGSAPSYQWKVNGINVGTNSTSYSNNTLANGDMVSCVITSNANCATGNPAASNIITMGVFQSLSVSANISSNPASPVCSGKNIIFTALPTNGGTTPTYQWKLNGVNVGTNSPIYSITSLANNDQVSCVVTSDFSCAINNPATSNVLTMTVNPTLTPSVTLSASPSTNFCPGTNVTFTATPANGGSNPQYYWVYNNMGSYGSSPTYSKALYSDGSVQCEVISNSNYACLSKNTSDWATIYFHTNPSPVNVSISANTSTVVCAGTNVTFTATPSYGHYARSYQWKKYYNYQETNIGTNSPIYSTNSLADNTSIYCIMTTDSTPCSVVKSNTLSMRVSQNNQVSINIAASPSTTVCTGTNVTFTATPVNGGLAPSYQWKLNGVNVGTNSSTYSNALLVNGDQVSCVLTSNDYCPSGTATSNVITMSVNPNLPISVTISANPASPVCGGTNVTFTTASVNGGTSPVYQWILNGVNVGSNSPTYSNAALSNADSVKCILTSNVNCPSGNPAMSNKIIMTVLPNLPVGVSISANPSGTICNGTNVTFTAMPSNGGANPIYQWFLNGVQVGSNNSTYSNALLNNGDHVSCILTSNAICQSGGPTASSNIIIMSVMQNLPVSVSITANPASPICGGTNVKFIAITANGGNSPAYQWYLNGIHANTDSSIFNIAILANGDQVRCVMTSNATCATGNPANSNTITMNVNTILPVGVSISADHASPVCSGTNVTFTALPVNGGTSPSFQWLLNGSVAGTNAPTYANASFGNGDSVKCMLISNVTCPSGTAMSNTLQYSVKSIPSSPGISVADSCGYSILTATNYTGTLQWSTMETTSSITVTNAGTYAVTQTALNGCTSAPGSGIAAPLTIPPAPIITEKNNCEYSVLTADFYTGTLLWSTSETTPSIVVTNPGIYTITQTMNGCTSAPESTIVLPFSVPPAPVVTVQNYCGYSVLTASGYTGTLLWSNSGTTSSITVMNAGTYTVTQTTLNGCTSTPGTGIAVPLTVLPAPVVAMQNYCGYSVLTASGYTGSLLWSTSETTSSITVTNAGSYTVTQTALNGCTSTPGYGVAAPLTIPPAPIVSVQNYCGYSVLTASSYTGTLLWSTSETTASITVTSAGSYTVTQTALNGCTSLPGSGIAAPINIPPAPIVTVENDCGYSTLTASGYAGTLLWNNSGTTSTITVTNAGTFSVIQTVNGCTGASGSGTAAPLNIPPVPVVTVQNNCGNSVLTASGYTGTLLWNTSATTASVTITTAGTYTVTQTGSNGCISAAGSGIAAPLAAPLVTASASPATICRGSSSTLTAGGASTYSWSGGLGTGSPKTVTPTLTTIYTVTGTNSNACTNTATVTVTIDPTVTVTASAASICKGTSSVLTASGATTYSWSNSLGSGSPKTVTPTATTTYTVTGTKSSCTNTASITITVNPIPTVTASASPSTICNGATSTLTGAGASSYTWSGGLGTGNPVIATPTTTTTYNVTGTSAFGCTNTTSVKVTVNARPTVVATANPSSICSGSSSTISANGAFTYSWSGGLGTGSQKTVAPVNTTIYIVTGTNSYSCTNTATITITVNQKPTVTVSASPSAICTGSSTTLTAGGATTYSWSGNLGTGNPKTAAPTSTTNYTITGTANSCTNTAFVTVTVNPKPTVTANASPTSISVGGSSTLTAGGAVTYVWNNGLGAGNPKVVSPTVTTTYTVTGTNANGCTNTKTVTVSVSKSTSSIDEGATVINDRGVLLKNYPNPFNQKTIVVFSVPEDTYVKLDIYDMTGMLVKNLFDGDAIMNQEYKAEFDGSLLPSGLYISKMTTNEDIYTGKMILLKE